MRIKVYRPAGLHQGSEWPKARAQYLRAHPLCVGCSAAGKTVPATVVDHIVPAEGNQLRFWDQGNWQPCCAWHHNSIKASLEKMWRKREIKVEALSLASREAIALTKRRMKVQIGLDGWPIE